VIYRITFACYGCHVHGDAAGSVDGAHNVPGTPVLDEDLARAAFEQQGMDQPAYHLDRMRRDTVRSNHMHTVVEAEVPPERIMNDFKAYASRHLNRMGLEGPGRKRWARHGSTRWLWKHIVAAIQ
jgi:hypothetical protein